MRKLFVPCVFVALASLAIACSSEGVDGAAPASCPPKASTSNVPGRGGASALEEVTSFGDDPGGLKMYVHAPADKPAMAVVLALHGCTQSAADYVAAGWNEVADRERLVIVYAEQQSSNNSMRCFRWWDPAHIGKDGEARSLANMVAFAHAKYGTKRAFVTGLSAGGAMTAVMLASYPEVFEAGAVMAGLPYKCATSQLDTYSCMSGRSHSAEEWAALVPTTSAAVAPRVSIWQGDADRTVRPANREELVKQWSRVNGVSDEPTETKTEGPATHRLHRDGSGIVRVESWEISNMGHGVALDPKSGCGKAGPYALDVGICSTEQAAAFFLGTSARSGSTSGDTATSGSAGPAGSSAPCP